MIFIILGISGCGKSTQAELLAKELGLNHISTGRLFRWELEKGTPLGVEAYQKWWGKGLWPPTEIAFQLLEPVLRLDLGKGFVLEGWPRAVDQAQLLDEYLEKKKLKVDCVFNLETGEDVAVERLRVRAERDRLAGKARPDDTSEATIQARFLSYKQTIEPIISYYDKRGILCRIDNSLSVEEVHGALLKEALKATSGHKI